MNFQRADTTSATDTTVEPIQQLNVTETSWEFKGQNAAGDDYTNRFVVNYDGDNGTTAKLISGEQGAGGTKSLQLDFKTVQMVGNNLGNNGLRFGSANGKHNFWKSQLIWLG